MTRSGRLQDALAAALDYARRGWPVLPLAPGKKRPHPRLAPHGFKSATRDAETIRRWWAADPRANVGVVTGAASGLVVLDLDRRDGVDGIEAARARFGWKVEGPTQRTGGGGLQAFYKHPGGRVRCRTGQGAIAPGVELKGDDGYVAVAPSVHPSGERYKWVESPDLPLPELPAWARNSARKPTASGAEGGPLGKRRVSPAEVLAGVPQGQRNDALFRYACSLRARGLDQAEAQALVKQAARACVPPYPSGTDDPPVAEILGHVWRDYAKAPPEAGLREDVRNGQAFADTYAERVRYCPDPEAWFIWDGRRWGRDEAHEAERLMQDLVRERLGAAAHIEDHDDRQRELKHWHSSMRMHRVQAALQAARSHPSLIIRLKDFDVDPLLLNVLNGTLDLRTARLRPHKPADRMTMLAPVAYDAEVDQSEWLRFLGRIVPDEGMRLFLQRAVGYSLTGSAEEEVLFFVSGPTASGKSTFISAIRAVLGNYAATANFETFVRRRDVGGPRSDLVRLARKRFVGSIEVEDGAALAIGLIKWLTGQDALCVRALYQNEIEFLPSFKLWLVANRRPRAADDDAALWRRILLVPFEESIPEAERDPEVKRRLGNPAIGGPAVLAWAVEGCRDWQQRRLRVPEAVEAATKAWRVENDPLADWVRERTVRGLKAVTPFKDLNASYRGWAEGLGLRPISAKKLAQRLQALGCTVEHTRRGRLYHGVGLVPGA